MDENYTAPAEAELSLVPRHMSKSGNTAQSTYRIIRNNKLKLSYATKFGALFFYVTIDKQQKYFNFCFSLSFFLLLSSSKFNISLF